MTPSPPTSRACAAPLQRATESTSKSACRISCRTGRGTTRRPALVVAQGLGRVDGVLPVEQRVLRRRVARAGRTVTGDAGGNATVCVTGAVDRLTLRHQARVRHGLHRRRLRGVVRGEVPHVFFRQVYRLAGHQRIDSRAALEMPELGDDVARVLPGDARPERVHAVAVCPVTGGAGHRLGLAGVGGPVHEYLGTGVAGEQGSGKRDCSERRLHHFLLVPCTRQPGRCRQ